ncbi:MAG: DUF2062 domain-containing protein [Desulfomonile sp.]|nr:DUF2062 domain-containing protein [Desulfomonile sp.]
MKRREASTYNKHPESEAADTPTDDRITGWRGRLHRVFVQPFVSSPHPPWFDARGVAIGLAISLGCPVGAQMMTLGVMRLIVRFNILIAFAVSWVMNPFTFVPIYYGYYRLGSVLLHRPEVMTLEAFRSLIAPLMAGAHFWETFRSFVALGWEFVLRWAAGAVVVTPIATILGYAAGYYLQQQRCKRRARKLGVSYGRLVRDMEMKRGARRAVDTERSGSSESV